MKVLAWYIDPNGIENTNTIKYPYSTSIIKCEILIPDTQMVYKDDNVSPTMVYTYTLRASHSSLEPLTKYIIPQDTHHISRGTDRCWTHIAFFLIPFGHHFTFHIRASFGVYAQCKNLHTYIKSSYYQNGLLTQIITRVYKASLTLRYPPKISIFDWYCRAFTYVPIQHWRRPPSGR